MTALKALLFSTILLGPAAAAPPRAEGELQQAIRKLAAARNFSWISMTLEETEGKGAKLAEVMEGQWDRDAGCRLSNPKSKSAGEAYLRGDRMALLLQDGWKGMEAKVPAPGAGKPDKTLKQAFEFIRSRSPLDELRSYLGRVENLTLRDNGLYSGTYAAIDVPVLIERALAAGRQLTDWVDPEARINLRIQDGLLASFELVISGREAKLKKGQPVHTLLAMSVDFSSVGTTEVEIPEEVRKLLQ